MSQVQGSTRITQVGRVMVPVSDQDRAIDFYGVKLGFELRADVPFGDGDRWVEVAPPGGETAIALVLPREGNPVGVMTNIALVTEDVDGDHASLKAAGVDVDEEVLRFGGPVPPMFFFRDQDGNTLLLVEG
jgi:catechol 2,3-dioxygenase-like lactoylglutathione lyase family enzyme